VCPFEQPLRVNGRQGTILKSFYSTLSLVWWWMWVQHVFIKLILTCMEWTQKIRLLWSLSGNILWVCCLFLTYTWMNTLNVLGFSPAGGHVQWYSWINSLAKLFKQLTLLITTVIIFTEKHGLYREWISVYDNCHFWSKIVWTSHYSNMNDLHPQNSADKGQCECQCGHIKVLCSTRQHN
jgi:hypothetical protein